MSDRGPRHVYALGLDLGQAADYSALVAARHGRSPVDAYDVGFLERWQGKPYPWIVTRVSEVVAALRLASVRELPPGSRPPAFYLAIDDTGVGRAVTDLFLQAKLDKPEMFDGVRILAVTITGGTAVVMKGFEANVPKRDLAGVVQALLQEERIKVAPALPLARTLLTELTGFRVKINEKTGHDSYGAGEDWRSADHDDLVLALALALWWSEWRARTSAGGSIDYTEEPAPDPTGAEIVWGGRS